MRILYFHQHFTTPKDKGGTRSYEFAKKLIERGHSVTMVCGQGIDFNLKPTKSRILLEGDVDGIHVIQITVPYSNSMGIYKRFVSFVKYALAGVRIGLRNDYDLLFATSTPLTAGLPGIVMKYLKRKKKKFVFEVRDLWPELPKALGLKNPFLIGGMSFLEKQNYIKSDACIGLSPGICEGIAKRAQPNKKIKLIPNGCDLDLFQPGDRSQLQLDGISPTDKVAVFTGAHGIANGLDAVLDAAKVIKSIGRNDIKLVFIGDGKEKERLKQRAKEESLDNCLFYNPMPKVQLNQVVANADIGLMILANVPAFYYGTSPNKFFDYISSGLPVFNNYPGWLADMIHEFNCGEVVEPNHPTAFANALIKLADNPELRKKYGKNARKLAEMKFSREDLSNQFVDFLEEVYNQ